MLAPPFLLEDYIPRYQLLNPLQESKKRSEAYVHLGNCKLCPRLCSVNHFQKRGICLVGASVVVNTIAPHFGEEPCLQGHTGGGSIFFSGCNLRCIFCQNHDIAHQENGFHLNPEELAERYIKLQETGNVHDINLVTPEHVVHQIVLSILKAKELGLQLPMVYNTSSFDSLASIELLEGLVDIYLPNFKVWHNSTSKRLLKAENYAEVAMESIIAMHAQVGDLCFTPDGLAKKEGTVKPAALPADARVQTEVRYKEINRPRDMDDDDNWSTTAEFSFDTNRAVLPSWSLPPDHEGAKAALKRRTDRVNAAIENLCVAVNVLAGTAEELTGRWKTKEEESDTFKAALDGKVEEAKRFEALYKEQRAEANRLQEEKRVVEVAKVEAEGERDKLRAEWEKAKERQAMKEAERQKRKEERQARKEQSRKDGK
ncbi:hypothetical protein LTR85_005236 [Meristemomyces frigidus]|nr:hypothetical protein LTR85_005236 [Meristemomyces frigidus]